MRRRIVIQLRRRERRKLQRRYRKTCDAHERVRIQIVLRYATEDEGAVEIARALGCSPSLVTRVARNYLAHGDLAFEDGRRNNGQSVIDEDLLQALAELVPQSPQDFGWERPTWTTELFARVLAAETGVVVSPTTVWRMLQILGARWGMAKPIVACPWTKAKKSRRIQAIRRALKKLRRGEVAYYQDEVDIHLNPKIGRDWMLKRQQKAVLTPGKNEKRYLAGALRVDGHRLICVEWHQKNSDLFILLLGKLRDAHPNATKIHLVLDNCKIHSSTKVATFLRHHDGLFVFHFLPPYSPRYNKIERFWRELHANVTRNHRCKTIGQLMREVRRFVRHEAQRRRQTAPLVLRRKQTRKAA